MSKSTSVCLLLALAASSAWAQSSEEQELAQVWGDAAMVRVATGSRQPLHRAPAVASVFTAADIRAMGAADLREVLERVPGLHVSRSPFAYEPKYQLRGISHDYSPQLLVLIDGVRRQSIYFGSAETLWVDMPVDTIERVEVVRGPGSALYGADAFSGVISITTKAASPGTRIGVQLASRRGRAGSLQWGRDWQGGHVGASLRLARSDGPDERIEADAQSALDALFGSHASLAPAAMRMQSESRDAALDLAEGAWTLRTRHKARDLLGSGPGLAGALAPQDRLRSRLTTLDLAQQREDLASDLLLESHLGGQWSSFDGYYTLFPAGAFGGLYPQGMVGAPGFDIRLLNASLDLSWSGWTGHRLRWGLGWQLAGVDKTRELKNFSFVLLPGVGLFPAPLGAVVDARSADGLFMDRHSRRLVYALLQDEWSLARDWTLTAGLRHDRYSDFGSTTNPRVALVWEASQQLTAKLMHGQAFRAPSFVEAHIRNNPVALGNPAITPERIGTTELALDWHPSERLGATLNLFRYRMSELIRFVPNVNPATGNTAQNEGRQRGKGLEAELRWQFMPGAQLQSALAWQRSHDADAGLPVAEVPSRLLRLGLDLALPADWHLQAQARHVAGRKRAAGDARPPVADYTLTDLSLRSPELGGGWSLLLAVDNLFDADAREPSPAPGNARFDFPLARRQLRAQLLLAF
ncbi:TonB-dependent receptor [Pelomonas sp. SE-A7]|uniref:TonB-dependent receptor plug domain-containing protein n=1 Tax=Pelomonas sp. SE-A7 TaxID=3054953 RepID=UPI00259C94A0|nr:TonB-dependent receptor [Pelomonas sp. SE-A7]MDM4767101.1 TonB-dependent receptor [Pelomonas sp. SE-A7]